ncbi:MAG TPA: hypothetical protein VGG34_05905 [Opitutaceae bacterium]
MQNPGYDWAAEARKHLLEPAVQADRRQRSKLKVELRYGRLFALLNLDPEKRRQLEDLLIKYDLAKMVDAFPSTSAETKEEATQRLASLQQTRLDEAQEIAATLGDDAAKGYSDYESSYPYRDSIESIADLMRANGAQVDEGTQESILSAYARVTSEVSSAASQDATNDQLAQMSADQLAALRAGQKERFDEQLASAMSQVLAPDQFQAFMAAELTVELGKE